MTMPNTDVTTNAKESPAKSQIKNQIISKFRAISTIKSASRNKLKTKSQLQRNSISQFELTEDFVQTYNGQSATSNYRARDTGAIMTKASEFPGCKVTIHESKR